MAIKGHLSWTRSGAIETCPLRNAFDQVLHIDAAVPWPMLRGRGGHECFCCHAKECLDTGVSTLGPARIKAIYEDALVMHNIPGELQPEVKKLYDDFLSDHEFPPTPGMEHGEEEAIRFVIPADDTFPEEVVVACRIDRYKFDRANRALGVIDYKTQERMYSRVDAEDSKQTSTYDLALIAKFYGTDVTDKYPSREKKDKARTYLLPADLNVLDVMDNRYDFVAAHQELAVPVTLDDLHETIAHYRRVAKVWAGFMEEWDDRKNRPDVNNDLDAAYAIFKANPGIGCKRPGDDESICPFVHICDARKRAQMPVATNDQEARDIIADWILADAKAKALKKAAEAYCDARGTDVMLRVNGYEAGVSSLNADGSPKLKTTVVDMNDIVADLRGAKADMGEFLSLKSNRDVRERIPAWVKDKLIVQTPAPEFVLRKDSSPKAKSKGE